MTLKEANFLKAYLQTGSVLEASKTAGIARNTAYKYLNDPDFMEELNREKSKMIEGASLKMRTAIDKAIDRVCSVLNDPATPPQVIINAFDALCRNERQLAEITELKGEVVELKALVQVMTTKKER